MHDAVRRINQEFNEKRYSRRFIDQMIREEIAANTFIQDCIWKGVELLEEWCNAPGYYTKKQQRADQLTQLDLEKLVTEVFVGIAYYTYPQLFTSVTAQLAGRLGWSDRAESITGMAEVVAVLCNAGTFEINKASKYAPLMVISEMPLSDKVLDFIEHSQYLPPMVCEPNKLRNNRDSAYLTVQNDSVILGSGNHHESDVCLDVLNTMNRIQLQLDTEFLCKVEEEPTYKFMDEKEFKEWVVEKRMTHIYPTYADYITDSKNGWMRFKKQSYRFYDLMVSQGNAFFLTHKVDKRGRIYANGFHISTMGTAFKKSSINFYEEEVVTGVPNT